MGFWRNLSTGRRVIVAIIALCVALGLVGIFVMNNGSQTPPPTTSLPPAPSAGPPIDVSTFPTTPPVKRPTSCPATSLATSNGAWVVPWLEDPNAPDLVPAQAKRMGLLDFFWLAMGPTPGTILQKPDNPEVRSLDSVLAAAQSGNACSLRFVTIVDNYSGGADPAAAKAWLARILLDPIAREQHVRAVAEEMARHPLADGLTVDYEYKLPDWSDLAVYAKSVGGQGQLSAAQQNELVDRISNGYTQLMQDLAAAMHHQGRQLRVAALTRTDSQLSSDSYLPSYIADYGAITNASDPSRGADQLALMTYDDHWSTGDPGPIAPLDWIHNVWNYATGYDIPPAKLAIALPAYAYDWPVDASGKTIQEAANLTPTEMAATHWQKVGVQDGEVHYTYRDSQGRTHQVWDAAAGLTTKKAAVKQYCNCPVMVWKVGNTDPTGSNLTGAALG